MRIAGQQLGMNENEQNAALQEYMRNGGVNLDPAVTAWCAAFVNASLGQAGLEGTGSNMARSFENWGQAVDTPQEGDLAVFWRDSPESGLGHVGFFQGYDEAGNIMVLGGNQNDSVSVAPYSPDQLLSFRRGDAPQNAFSQSQPVNMLPTPQPQNIFAQYQGAEPLDVRNFLSDPTPTPMLPIGRLS